MGNMNRDIGTMGQRTMGNMNRDVGNMTQGFKKEHDVGIRIKQVRRRGRIWR